MDITVFRILVSATNNFYPNISRDLTAYLEILFLIVCKMVSNGIIMIVPVFNVTLKFFFLLYTVIYLKFHLQSTFGDVNGYNYERILKSYQSDKEALACTFVQFWGLGQLEKFSAPVVAKPWRDQFPLLLSFLYYLRDKEFYHQISLVI